VVQVEPALVCLNPERLIEWCTEVIGFTVVERATFAGFGAVVKLRCGDARLKLFTPESDTAPNPAPHEWSTVAGWRYVALVMEDPAELDRIAAAAGPAGGTVLGPPSAHRPNALAAMVTDPEGNAWELFWEE
jgi:catechol 2,3-dioxygenase-like lactoylglutathione lyase family enzyme